MRLLLALRCFFAVLFGRGVPVAALPQPWEPPDWRAEKDKLVRELADSERRLNELAGATKVAKAELVVVERERDHLRTASGRFVAIREAPGSIAERQGGADQKALTDARAQAARFEASAEEWKETAAKLEARVTEARAAESAAKDKLGKARDDGALAVLAWLQREGRLIDFLEEPIDGYDDAQVGAAVRAIHQGCKKVVDQALALEPVLAGEDGAKVEVPAGFDPVAIQLSGNVRGSPPFKGTLVHHGWRTSKVQVAVPETIDGRVLAPAEVEL